MSAPNYTVSMVAYPVSPSTPLPIRQCTVYKDGVYQPATLAIRGTLRSSGVITAPGAVNQGAFMQSFGDVSADFTQLGAGVACYARVSDAGYIERADPLTSSDDICGFCEADGSCHLFFGGLVSPSIAIIAGVGTMNTTNPTIAAATGIVLPSIGRVFTVELNNTKASAAFVFLYDGVLEIGRIAVPAGSTETVPFVNGQDLTTNLNYSVSSSQSVFTADATGLVVASCRYAPAGAASTDPVISQINPNTGATAGGTSVVLGGVNFTGATQVLFDGVAATGLVVNSNTQVSCVTPAHAAQSVTVSIVTPAGTATYPNGFTYSDVVAAPAVSSVAPTFGATAGGTTIVITGTGFVTGATVAIAATACTSVVVNSSTQITCVTGAHASVNNATLQVTNPSLLSGTLPSAFNYSDAAAPTVVSILPTSGTIAGGTAFTLVTTNAVTGATVKFDTASATSVNVASAISVTGVTPAHGAGVSSVILRNPDSQTHTLPSAYTYAAPPPTIDPATYNISGWWDMDDFHIGMQTCPGRASAGTSGSHAMTVTVGPAVTNGPAVNGKSCIVIGGNALNVAAQEADLFSPTGFTFYQVIDVTAINALSNDAALFYARSQALAVASGAGIYVALSDDNNIELNDYNGSFSNPGAIVSQAVPTSGYILLIGTYDGSTLSLQVNGGTPGTKAFAGPLTPAGGVALNIGYSGSAYTLNGAKLLNMITAPVLHSPSDITAFRTYFSTIYGLSF